MTTKKYVELNDDLIYLWVSAAMICIVFTLISMIFLCFKWSKASDALNPSQYKGRSFYVMSLMLAFISVLIHSICVVFFASNAVIDWNYDKVDDIHEEMAVSILVISAPCFFAFTFIPYLQRIQLIYELSNVTTFLLRLLQILWAICCAMLTLRLIIGGFSISHHHDQSSGVILLRPDSQIVAYAVIPFIPLTLITWIVLVVVYRLKIKGKLNNQEMRKQQLRVVTRQILLVSIASFVFTVLMLLLAFGDTANMAMFFTTATLTMTICAVLTLEPSHSSFNRICWPCSLCMLRCCLCSDQKGDKELLTNQAAVYSAVDVTEQSNDSGVESQNFIN